MDWYYRLRISRKLASTRGNLRWRTVYFPKLKAIYLPTPKVAGSTIIATLIKADGSEYLSTIDDHNTAEARFLISAERAPGEFWQALHNGNCFRFAFVRNPYDRVLSAFLDKVANGRVRRFRKLLSLPIEGDVSFRQFLEAVSQQSTYSMNRHWRPQANLISPRVRLDFLGRFEQFDADFALVRRTLNIEDTLITICRTVT